MHFVYTITWALIQFNVTEKARKKEKRLELDLDGTLYRITMCAFNDFQIQGRKRKIQITFTFHVQFYFACFITTYFSYDVYFSEWSGSVYLYAE